MNRADENSEVTATVSENRPDPVDRLDEAAIALEDLRGAFALHEPLATVLRRVADSATKVIPDADAVTITVLEEQTVRTAAATDDQLTEIDQAQYTAQRGPCLQAATTLRPVRAVVGNEVESWPEFDALAAKRGICAYLSVPLLALDAGGEEQLVGSLNVYSYTPTAFDPFDEGLMRLFTTAAGMAITNAQAWHTTKQRLAQLETALVSRAAIDQAKGVLMAVHGCDAIEAFAMLVHQSQNTNTKLRDVAHEILMTAKRN
ncbi:GAF domain-containing protein [Lentzea atacamensis]|uniref:GAF domain-containing protein n=1 Tax=Lentzea atacamensis TaxID=531938 RepID=A0ABX9E5Z1_9PSEU|nr:GAF and ANTAR domain-containing protein [Lentzea atacamensis]RAS64779.1 GAF domain-containing protein [Lentzea atacamensis]